MEYNSNYEDGEIVEQQQRKTGKQNNVIPFWGNENTMNLNPLILTNIQGSSYFKVNLFKLKTYHEVVDEIYYQVKHMEPWERGSRKTSGQTGMCGGVRGVGAGGIVSSAYCLLYKLYTLKLTRKQVNGLMNHTDSPYIRGLGFMYIRYTQPPADLFDWYADYLQDDEEIDVKAGGGQTMTIGQMVRLFMTKLEWFSTLFPRIPVPIQKQIEQKMEAYAQENGLNFSNEGPARGAREEVDRFENGAGRDRDRRNYGAQSSERYAGSSYKSREERDDRRPPRDMDRYTNMDRREKYREKDDRRPVRGQSTQDRAHRSEDRAHRSHSEERRRYHRDEEKHSRDKYDKDNEEKHSHHRSKEKKKHKKKHKHHSRSRSRSHERSSDKKYR